MDTRLKAEIKYIIRMLEKTVADRQQVYDDQPLWQLKDKIAEIAVDLDDYGLKATYSAGRLVVGKDDVEGKYSVFIDDGAVIRYRVYNNFRCARRGSWQKGKRWWKSKRQLLTLSQGFYIVEPHPLTVDP